MRLLLNYLALPAEQTDFEVNYLNKMNRVGVFFFWANLPVFVLVALFNDTNPGLALLLTSLVLAGPTAAAMFLDNPRHVSCVHGFTAMCMGGLLVHFGQGPMQIEMHFYFFSLLAVLSMFANPMVIVVAALTVTFHHTVIWLLIPSSVFNYDASLWVVAVHAVFVVVESCAAIFITRSFFDNVIGLELIVQSRTAELAERNRDMKLVLDNVNQGLFTINREAEVVSECSAKVQDWMGVPAEPTMVGYLAQVDHAVADYFEFGWEDVIAGFMPLAVTLDQLPKSFSRGDQHFQIDYEPIRDEGSDEEDFEKLLVVISDITEQIARAEAKAEQLETMQIFEHYLADKSGFLEFFSEGAALLRSIVDEHFGDDLGQCKRSLHTLKGNALMFGLDRFAAYVHHLEDILIEKKRRLSATERAELNAQWSAIQDRLNTLLGERRHLSVELEDAQYNAILDAVEGGLQQQELLTMIHSWKLEPIARRLERLAVQARRIGRRLGKGDITITIEDNAVETEPQRFSDFWSSFIHIVRNALDHGIESSSERIEQGKSPNGHLYIKTWIEEEQLTVDISDDGRGIDWERLSDKAREHGYIYQTHDDLIAFMFRDGVTTKDYASQISGRGVGLGVVKQSVETLGGVMEFHSAPGEGTRFRFVLPLADRVAA